jgi:acetyltransferase-like isoleucine patch superfamily enzyme
MSKGKISKELEKAFFLYPLLHFTEIVACLVLWIKSLDPFAFLLLVFVTYLQSPLIWRYFRARYGLPEGITYLGKHAPYGNLWYVAHQLQHVYTAFHYLERMLMLIPGAYSAWLRLWGSKIGKKITWTPEAIIVDRTHLTIGDRCLVGNRTYITAHAIKKKENKYLLYVKSVEIGNDVVLAYECHITCGAKVGDRALVESGGAVYPNQSVEPGATHERFEEVFSDRFHTFRERLTKGTSAK